MVGLVGYPNVGKSSTINAIFGAKKTAVAPTPGKTKHFQTLNVSPTLCLCDCPGAHQGLLPSVYGCAQSCYVLCWPVRSMCASCSA
jgi:GTPase Era involved in 16S rRNA processing